MKKLLALLLLAPLAAFAQTVDYQPFANGVGANVETQGQYISDLGNPAALQFGFLTGVAKSNQVNKVLRQQATVTSAIANMISQSNGGTNVLDDGNVATLTAAFIDAVQAANAVLLTSVSGTNTITATFAPSAIAPTSYAAGQRWVLIPAVTNTGPVTLNINSIGARTISKNGPTGPIALVAGDLVAGNLYSLTDAGSQLIVTGRPSSASVTTQVFTASGTWSRPTGVKSVVVEVLGAGGGGGGSNSGTLSFFSGSGGGAGGYARKWIDVTNIATSTITIGAAGSGGSAGSNNGSAGTASSWVDGSNTVTGGGGSPGLGSSRDFQPGGTGGSASGGDFNVVGNGGGWSWVNTSTFTVSGSGGGSVFGGGAPGTVFDGAGTNQAAGVAGGFGAGGSGATTTRSTTNEPGGNGGGGLILVREFR